MMRSGARERAYWNAASAPLFTLPTSTSGNVFVYALDTVIRIRTGEEGEAAI